MAPPVEDPGRISQFLPSVKCTSCSHPVPIHELEGHICPTLPSSSLAGRLQNLVANQQPTSPAPRQKDALPRRSRALSFGFRKASISSTLPPPHPVVPPVPQAPLELVMPPLRKDSYDGSLPRTKRSTRSQNLPLVPFPVQSSALSVATARDRALSNASVSNSIISRDRAPSTASQRRPRPSVDSSRSRNLSTATTSSSGRPSYDSTSQVRTPDNSQLRPHLPPSPSNKSNLSNHSDYNLPILSQTSPQFGPRYIVPPPSVRTPIPQAQHQHQLSFLAEEPDTKIGGEAGMAGVGRRGFQAAARAALFASPQIIVRRRPNAPDFLDLGNASHRPNTPPLSPSGNSPSHSPSSQCSPVSAGCPATPALTTGTSMSNSQNSVIFPQQTPSPRFSGRTTTTPLPIVEDFDRSSTPKELLRYDEEYEGRPFSPMSESDYGGLAYADSADEDGPVLYDELALDGSNRIAFPSYSPRSSTSSASIYSPRVPARSFSVASSVSEYTSRMTAKSIALDQAIETLLDGVPPSPKASVIIGQPNHPFPAFVPESHSVLRDSKPLKLPTRAHTSPKGRHEQQDGKKAARSATSVRASTKAAKGKPCVSCEKVIEDWKWIPMDGGGFLCDQCWKNMYLPKCRRCDLPIEKQAVSSSDGQLKGKYHRDCFNCHSCHELFPDKTFYVFDGKPFCAYHYHQANGSLCAAPTCGQPIEGPCAVSHAGDKYHPDHLVCSHSRCTERLEEYWEVDGRMYCDVHMKMVEQEDHRDVKHAMNGLFLQMRDKLDTKDMNSTRAMRRVTRFIDIGSSGNAGQE